MRQGAGEQQGIEITDYAGKRYSYIRIPDLKFSGVVDWSPNQNFGLAVGGQGFDKTAVFLELKKPTWSRKVCNPCDVRLCDDGVGVFLDSPAPGKIPELWFFHRDGLLFHVSYPGIGTLQSIAVTPNGLVIESDRRRLTYSLNGILLEESKFRPSR